ncbi:sigma 54-interacting transcriptional regulator [Alkalihalobacterium alkalinitrilicum]|uniref:sigma 54-interacting transcriptional regulator n=1 Tax=Alkalihalobacterium alkalinitrilicum TaxID=427920 RepID=UPI0009956076|nr:sigma-54-dependent Fis family transcriptional regulator [Alkalihalobacterium alkalinitrilicum]
MQIRDYCTQDMIKLYPESKISQVLEAFLKHRIDIACIIDQSGMLYGILSKSTIFQALLNGANIESTVESYIIKNVVTFKDSDGFEFVRTEMIKQNVAHGVILDEKGYLFGVISKSDIIRGFLHETTLLVKQQSDLIENLQNGVIAVDANGIILNFNRVSERLFGIKKSKVMGKCIEKTFPEVSEQLKSTLRTSTIKELENIQINQNSIIANFIPITHRNKVNGAMAVLQDITQLENIAKELETTKNLQHTIHHALTLSYDAVAITDEKGLIVDANNTFLDLFDIPEEDLLFQHWSKSVPELHLNIDREEFRNPDGQGEIIVINNKTCFIIKEYICRSGKFLGVIVKIIYRQLEQWKEMFQRIEELESELYYYKDKLHKSTQSSTAFDQIISANKQVEIIKKQALLSSKSTSTVLITGESGTGKELFAEAIHKESGRPGNFVKVNCAAIPSELLESEFFGYAEGAFTGAKKGGKKGRFELANEGTLFLDEIGDMPLSLQAKLLRVLQEQTFEPVGGTKSKNVNVRIITATNKDLKRMVKDGEFREDLYYRIDVVHLELPSLKDRTNDLPLLCDHLIKKLNKKLNKNIIGITPSTLSLLQAYDWPGNIRQLENVLERAMNMGITSWIETHHLPDEIQQHKADFEVENRVEIVNDKEEIEIQFNSKRIENNSLSLEEVEKRMIIDTLRETENNRSEAAKVLGISRSGLYKKIQKYKINHEIHLYYSVEK